MLLVVRARAPGTLNWHRACSSQACSSLRPKCSAPAATLIHLAGIEPRRRWSNQEECLGCRAAAASPRDGARDPGTATGDKLDQTGSRGTIHHGPVAVLPASPSVGLLFGQIRAGPTQEQLETCPWMRPCLERRSSRKPRTRPALRWARTSASSVARLELFCAGLEAGQLGVWAWDIPSSRMTWSTNLEGWHGRPEKSLDGTFSFSAENLAAQDQPGVLAAIQQTLRTREPCRLEYRLTSPAGRENAGSRCRPPSWSRTGRRHKCSACAGT